MRPNRKKQRSQSKVNRKLKKKLFGHLFIAPCIYCKQVFLVDDLTVEHITPLCLDGTNDPDNIALACAPCNHEMGRQAWFKRVKSIKQLEIKKYYEQHYSKHRDENRSSPIQDEGTPAVYRQE